METFSLHPIRVLRDNYVWLVATTAGDAVLVDPGEAGPVLAVLRERRLRLRSILLTHHHPDHIGGVAGILEEFDAQVFAPRDPRITCATRQVDDVGRVGIAGTGLEFTAIHVPGHTSSHVAYFGRGLLFCGDTLFSVGCGRLFEGTPEQMLNSLDKLAALAADTKVCCGHEYTESNCAFALGLEPGNRKLQQRAAQVRQLRAAGHPSVPSTLADELDCNPFLRTDSAEIRASLSRHLPADASRVEVFAAVRALKDAF